MVAVKVIGLAKAILFTFVVRVCSAWVGLRRTISIALLVKFFAAG